MKRPCCRLTTDGTQWIRYCAHELETTIYFFNQKMFCFDGVYIVRLRFGTIFVRSHFSIKDRTLLTILFPAWGFEMGLEWIYPQENASIRITTYRCLNSAHLCHLQEFTPFVCVCVLIVYYVQCTLYRVSNLLNLVI